MDSLRQLIQFLIQLSQWIPITELRALVDAAMPFPADWRDKLQLTGWLQKVGVIDPLASVIVHTVTEKFEAAQIACMGMKLRADEVAMMIEDEAVAMGVDPSINPERWKKILDLILKVLPFIIPIFTK